MARASAVESLATLRIVRGVRRQDLDGDDTIDDTIEARVARAVDLAYAAGAERGNDLAWTEASSASASVMDVRGPGLYFADHRSRLGAVL